MPKKAQYIPMSDLDLDKMIDCLTVGCRKQATTQFKAYGVSSFHCDDCVVGFKKDHPETKK